MDELGFFTPVADVHHPSPFFFVPDEVCTVRTGQLVGVFLSERSLARVHGWD
jgi:hypothetical protein